MLPPSFQKANKKSKAHRTQEIAPLCSAARPSKKREVLSPRFPTL